MKGGNMNICEKIDFIKQANIVFNYELSRMRYSRDSWRTIIKSLTVEEIVSDEFNNYLLASYIFAKLVWGKIIYEVK